MAQHDPASPASVTVVQVLISVVTGLFGTIGVWVANRHGLLGKRADNRAASDRHILDVAIEERRVIFEGQRDDIDRLERRIERLELALQDKDAEIDRLRDERNEARHKEGAARQAVRDREWTIRLQAMELVKHLEYDARIQRLEQQVRELGGKPTNGH